jgi:hypothetical protein
VSWGDYVDAALLVGHDCVDVDYESRSAIRVASRVIVCQSDPDLVEPVLERYGGSSGDEELVAKGEPFWSGCEIDAVVRASCEESAAQRSQVQVEFLEERTCCGCDCSGRPALATCG